jgi:hypothetical protein
MYDDGAYEVEISNPDSGATIAFLVAAAADLESAP